jgi:hypothetical protein
MFETLGEMALNIAYQLGEMGGVHVAPTRDQAISFCLELMAKGAEIRSVWNDDKRSKETLTIEAIHRCAAALRGTE